MWKSVKEYVIDAVNSPEGEIRVTLWVSPDGELAIDVAGAGEMMELEVAEEVRSKISSLLRFRTTEKGLKLIAKRLRVAKTERSALEKQLEKGSARSRELAKNLRKQREEQPKKVSREERYAAALISAEKRKDADKRR